VHSGSQGRSNIWLIGGVGAAVLVAAQFIRPGLRTGPVRGEIEAPAPVAHVLKTSCYNCHSNETKLPWFDRIVPAYWLVVADVKSARRSVNLSQLAGAPASQLSIR